MSKKVENINPNQEFQRVWQKKLNDKGLRLTLPELKLVYLSFVETILHEYLYKYKPITFPGFGRFSVIMTNYKNMNFKGGIRIKISFKQSKTLKDVMNERHKLYSEDRE